MLSTSRKLPHRSLSGWAYACHVGVGLIITALVLRTWLVQGLIVPVTVAAGSMAQTYLGPHRQTACRSCGFPIRCGLERLPADGYALCPNCGDAGNDLTRAPDQPGSRLLIDRATFNWLPPERWDTVIVRFPGEAQQLYLKRLVGFPGEAVEIRHGDLYINGQLARKTFSQICSLAALVHDHTFRPKTARPRAPRWQPERQDSHWQANPDGSFSFAAEANHSRNGFDWLSFHPFNNRPVTDDYAYNQSESRRLNEVHDVGLTCEVEWQGVQTLALQAVDGLEQFELCLVPQQQWLELRHNGQMVERVSATFPRKKPFELAWWLVDQQLLFAIEGELLLTYLYKAATPRLAPRHPLAIGAGTGQVKLAKLRVWRDVYYTDPGAGRFRFGLDRPYRLREDEFFVLGDNSPISIDSRVLPSAGIPGKLIVGKPLPSR